MVSVSSLNPEDALAVLVQTRSSAEQQAFISKSAGAPSQALIELISTKIRELLPRDLDLAEALANTNFYVADLVNSTIAWAYANRSRAQVFYTMRKSAEAEPYFDKAVQL